jgi:predicted metal-dependent phosphoesterase TrpH
MPRGALHIHSTYSDGERTLAQLRSTFQAAGCCFICTTDHAEAFDEARVDEYRRECESLSDETFAVVGGLEYRCDGGMHVLGYGVTALIDSTDPAEVFEIIARPSRSCRTASKPGTRSTTVGTRRGQARSS